jgi:hypothetical protein
VCVCKSDARLLLWITLLSHGSWVVAASSEAGVEFAEWQSSVEKRTEPSLPRPSIKFLLRRLLDWP